MNIEFQCHNPSHRNRPRWVAAVNRGHSYPSCPECRLKRFVHEIRLVSLQNDRNGGP